MISPSTHRVVYLSGPITGRPQGNWAAFAAAAVRLRHQGFCVVNPHELGLENQPWEACMRRCLGELVLCDAVAVLRGWRFSSGTALEVSVARSLRMPVVCAQTLRSVDEPLAMEEI